MPVWCPNCRAMLPEGQDECPVCGTRLGEAQGEKSTCSQILWISVYLVGIALIPILVALLIGGVCVLTAN